MRDFLRLGKNLCVFGFMDNLQGNSLDGEVEADHGKNKQQSFLRTVGWRRLRM
jgi:hypothetical protein